MVASVVEGIARISAPHMDVLVPDSHIILDPPSLEAGDALRNARKALGMSRAKLAELLGVQEKTIYNWESGSFAPSVQHRPALANALGLRFHGTDSGEDFRGQGPVISQIHETGTIEEQIRAELFEAHACAAKSQALIMRAVAKLSQLERQQREAQA